ncbi:MAG: hypothetical protein WB682_13145, partial [Candidatus Dormiibacterota bacterium]
AEYGPALRLSQLDGAGIEIAESVQWESRGFKLLVNDSHDRWSDRLQVGLMDVRNEGREERTRVGERQAFPTVQPEQIGAQGDPTG